MHLKGKCNIMTDSNTFSQLLPPSVFSHLPIADHTWVFFIVLCIILLAPMIFSKLRIPHLIGMILAGVLVGEHGLGLLKRDDSFELFGQVGIYYIMFLAGLEMDLAGLKQNRTKGLVFGAFTALIPFALGLLAGYCYLHYSLPAALLLACIFASHTLVSYPIVGRYGLAKSRSVVISVAATMVALLFALLVLAVLAGTLKGTADLLFWLVFAAKFLVFLSVLFLLFPRMVRWFFRHYSDAVMHFIFVLGMVFLAAALAEACGLEGILGAFLAGLVFNRFIPRSAPLMNRLEFVGNAIFIPYFLIGVGMLVNLRPIFTSSAALSVVAVMVIVGTLSKYIASYVSRRMFGMSRGSGLMMFGLTEAHAAGALAMVMVGTGLEVAPGVPLMDNAVLDGVVVMILLSCIISSLATDQAARLLRVEEDRAKVEEKTASDDEKIMVPINNTANISNLMQTAIMMRNPSLNRGLICLNVVNDDDSTGVLQRHSRECLQLAERVCAAADVKVQSQSRLAVNFVNGVIHAFRENDASEIIIGLHRRRHPTDSFLGRFAEGLVDGLTRQVVIVNFRIPINTIRRIIVAVPEQAQFETGFYRWVERIGRMGVELGCRLTFYASETTAEAIRTYLNNWHPLLRDEYKLFTRDDRVEDLAQHVSSDHLFVLVAARYGSMSYSMSMRKMEKMLEHHFADKSLMVIYPEQGGAMEEQTSFSAPHQGVTNRTSRITRWLSRWMSKIG